MIGTLGAIACLALTANVFGLPPAFRGKIETQRLAYLPEDWETVIHGVMPEDFADAIRARQSQEQIDFGDLEGIMVTPSGMLAVPYGFETEMFDLQRGCWMFLEGLHWSARRCR